MSNKTATAGTVDSRFGLVVHHDVAGQSTIEHRQPEPPCQY